MQILSFSPLHSFLSLCDTANVASRLLFVGGGEAPGAERPRESHSMAVMDESHGVFLPIGGKGARRPMVVMLHGAFQHFLDFAALTAMNAAAQRRGFIVLYLFQPGHVDAHNCWNWYDAGHQSREGRDAARIARLTLQVADQYDVDMSRVHVAGFSAGGAMAALMGELFPEIFAAVGVHSGLAPRAVVDLGSALAAMRRGAEGSGAPSGVPTIVFHGDRDSTVDPVNGMQVIRASFGGAEALKAETLVGHDGRRSTRRLYGARLSSLKGEHWTLHGAGHVWSGGKEAESYADPLGPDASNEMLRFFAGHSVDKRVGSRAASRVPASQRRGVTST